MDSDSHSQSSGSAARGDDYTVSLHWVAVLVVLLSSAAGVLLPVLSKRASRLQVPGFAYAIGRCLSIGVVVAVALVHMLQPAQEALQDDGVSEALREWSEPLPFVLCTGGAILMHTIELIVRSAAGGCQRRRAVQEAFHTTRETEEDVEEASRLLAAPPARRQASGGNDPDADALAHSHFPIGDDDPSDAHFHHVIDAVLLEFGVSLHSIFVGLVIGVCADQDVLTLAVAISLHQLFEGVALGSRLVGAAMQWRSEIVFTAFFALSTPCGAAVGILSMSHASIDTSGQSYLLTQGVLDALCAGILLYLGFGMLFRDFPHDMAEHCNVAASGRPVDPGAEKQPLKAVVMVLSVWIGAALMSAIGWWV